MGMSIAQMRATRHAPRLPQRSQEMCLAQDLVAEVLTLRRRKEELAVTVRLDEDGNRVRTDGSPAKASEGGASLEVTRIDERLSELYGEMREHTGEMLWRGIDPGEWRRWADEHPGRIEGHDSNGRPIEHPVDAEVTYGYCDATALLARLGDFAESWSGEPVTAEDWAWIRANAVGGDLKKAAQLVVQMHEGEAAHAPKSPTVSSGTSAAATT